MANTNQKNFISEERLVLGKIKPIIEEFFDVSIYELRFSIDINKLESNLKSFTIDNRSQSVSLSDLLALKKKIEKLSISKNDVKKVTRYRYTDEEIKEGKIAIMLGKFLVKDIKVSKYYFTLDLYIPVGEYDLAYDYEFMVDGLSFEDFYTRYLELNKDKINLTKKDYEKMYRHYIDQEMFFELTWDERWEERKKELIEIARKNRADKK